MTPYLASTKYINWRDRDVAKKAAELAEGCSSEEIVAKKCFEYVRDSIKHSWDFKLNPVTCRASDVLQHETGYCYAKSHLLAALLRANNIPAGLCYQRLAVGVKGAPFCLHGLNAVYLQQYGWYRIDPRGNKAGVDAAFSPPIERLAFPSLTKGETLLPEIWPEPMPMVVATLTRCTTVEQVAEHLPDVEIIDS